MFEISGDQRYISLLRLEAATPWVRVIARIYSVLASLLHVSALASAGCTVVAWLVYPDAILTNIYVTAIPVVAAVSRWIVARRADRIYSKVRQMHWDAKSLRDQLAASIPTSFAVQWPYDEETR